MLQNRAVPFSRRFKVTLQLFGQLKVLAAAQHAQVFNPVDCFMTSHLRRHD